MGNYPTMTEMEERYFTDAASKIEATPEEIALSALGQMNNEPMTATEVLARQKEAYGKPDSALAPLTAAHVAWLEKLVRPPVGSALKNQPHARLPGCLTYASDPFAKATDGVLWEDEEGSLDSQAPTPRAGNPHSVLQRLRRMSDGQEVRFLHEDKGDILPGYDKNQNPFPSWTEYLEIPDEQKEFYSQVDKRVLDAFEWVNHAQVRSNNLSTALRDLGYAFEDDWTPADLDALLTGPTAERAPRSGTRLATDQFALANRRQALMERELWAGKFQEACTLANDKDREIIHLRAEREAWKHMYEELRGKAGAPDTGMLRADETGNHNYHGPTKDGKAVPDPVHERAHEVVGDILGGRIIRPARDQMEKALADARVKDGKAPAEIPTAPNLSDPRRIGR